MAWTIGLLVAVPTLRMMLDAVRALPFKPKAEAQLSMATIKAVATFMVERVKISISTNNKLWRSCCPSLSTRGGGQSNTSHLVRNHT